MKTIKTNIVNNPQLIALIIAAVIFTCLFLTMVSLHGFRAW